MQSHSQDLTRALAICVALLTSAVHAEVGDPQIKTDHPWYPGELAISTFDRLAATQAQVYQRETGRPIDSDEDKSLASWYWRNLHYAHCQEGTGDYFDAGFGKGQTNREYWHGLFAHGLSLCGTTHAQWSAEMHELLGHCRSRCVGVAGHVSFEVFLKGGEYGKGKWALLDHDVSTVIFDKDGKRLLSIGEIMRGDTKLRENDYRSTRQRGWRIAGLYERDVVNLYDVYNSALYLSGYAGPPPMVHLRSGESLRRYTQPGLKDGKTFVFWGLNRNQGGVAGPQRDRTWVNQPEKMYQAKRDAGSSTGRLRYANAVYTYKPRFNDHSYREGVVSESDQHVTFEFNTPYVIAATPANDQPWGIYDNGCSGGLVVTTSAPCSVAISTDSGNTWQTKSASDDSIDFTDQVKGHQQYLIRFDTDAGSLANADLNITTVCQMNAAVIPRLRSGKNEITYAASGRALYSAGPNRDQASAHVVRGSMDQPGGVTLELATPRGESAVEIYAASHNQSGNPPSADVSYAIDYSLDGGQTWKPIVSDWRIERRQPEPPDLWSQSFTYGQSLLATEPRKVQVRFNNTGRKTYRRVEAHLLYQAANPTAAKVTFAWTEDGGAEMQAVQRVGARPGPQRWTIDTSGSVETRYVEIAAP
jgi:hypothetical protein